MNDLEYIDSDSVRLSADGKSIIIIDQTLLPDKLQYLQIVSLEQMFEAVKSLRVRGAPAIGIFAGYAMYVLAENYEESFGEFFSYLKAAGEHLISSRPTAVNLSWAVNRVLSAGVNAGRNYAVTAMHDEALKIHIEDIAVCKAIAENALSLISNGAAVLTHCNAGALATSRLGTGLGALLLGAQKGYKLKAYVDETRPLMQGARLTAFELQNAGVETVLICDNMAAHFMSQGKINAVFVGCDRVAANGDTANKIGTLSAAVSAKYFGVPFYVCCPFSTIDTNCKNGSDITIEERSSDEITDLYFEERIAPQGISCRNPAFDITPSELITAIITEKGIFHYPYDFLGL